MVKKVGVAILGLGVVGGGTYQTLVEHRDFYLKTQQVDISVEMVLDRALDRLAQLGVPQEKIAKNIEEVLANPNVDIVIDLNCHANTIAFSYAKTAREHDVVFNTVFRHSLLKKLHNGL